MNTEAGEATDLEVLEAHIPVPVALAATLVSVGLVLYRKNTGEITQVMRCSTEAAEVLISDEIGMCEIPGDGPQIHGLEGLNFARDHIVETRGLYPMIQAKPVCPVLLDGQTLRRLPLPCTIEITAPGDEARTYDEADSDIVKIDFDHPGEYTVTVRSMRYQPGVYLLTVKDIQDGK